MTETAPAHCATDTEPAPLPKQRRRPGWLTYLIAGVIIIAGVSWSGLWLWEQAAQQEFDAQLKFVAAQGEPVWFADLEPPPLPLEQDGTREFVRASEVVHANMLQTGGATGKSTDLLTLNQGVNAQFSPADFTLFRQALAENAEAVKLLRVALDRGGIRTGYDYQSPAPSVEGRSHIVLKFYPGLLIALQGRVALAEGNADRAFIALTDSLRLVTLDRDEPRILNCLDIAELEPYTNSLFSSAIAQVNLNSAQRRELDGMLADVDANFGWGDAIRASRAVLHTTTINSEQVFAIEGPITVNSWATAQFWLYRHVKVLPLRDASTASQQLTELAEAVDRRGPEALQMVSQIRAQSVEYSKLAWHSASLAHIDKSHLKVLAYRQHLTCLRVALRVDEYYRRTGAFPASLRDVLDEAMPDVPLGLLSNKPLAYRAVPGGFEVYDIGADQVDDLGTEDQELVGMVYLQYPPSAAGSGPADPGNDP